MRRKPHRGANPIDPATGRPRMGRPPKNRMQGEQMVERSVGLQEPPPPSDPEAPVTVASVDPTEDITRSVDTGREFIEKFKKKDLLSIPAEIQAKYPDGDFFWAINTPESVRNARSQYHYDVAQSDTPLFGQTDTTVQFKELVLMVRPKRLRELYNRAMAELAAEQSGDADPEGTARGAEREALQEAYAGGYRPRDVRFFTEHEREDPRRTPASGDETRDYHRAEGERARVKGAAGRGSKFWGGGIPG